MTLLTEDMSKSIADFLGPNWELFEHSRDVHPDLKYSVSFKLVIPYEKTHTLKAGELPKTILDSIVEIIKDTPLVKRSLEAKNYQLDQKEKKIEEYYREIQRLKMYETHYRMSYEIAHGVAFNESSGEQ